MSRWKSYQIASVQAETDVHIKAEVLFDPEHPLYKGHFPGRPVTPGVVMIGMIEDVFGIGLGRRASLKEARMIKFHHPLIPQSDKRIAVEMTYHPGESGDLVVKAVVRDQELKYCSLNGRYSIESSVAGTI